VLRDVLRDVLRQRFPDADRIVSRPEEGSDGRA
jgi:hypothetical protein